MKYTIKFDLAKSTGENKPIRARICFAGNRVDLRLGLSCPVSCWNPNTQLAKTDKPKNRDLCNQINSTIKELIFKVDDLFKKSEVLKNRVPTANEIKRIANANYNSKISLEEVFNLYLQNNQQLEDNTYNTYISLRNTLSEFDSNLQISDVSQNTLQEFVDYLIYTRNLKNSSVKSYIKQIKCIINFAIEQKLYTGDALLYKIKLKETEKKIVYLDKEELFRLYNLEVEKEIDKEIILAFCFCCFSGLRFSDMQKLTWKHINNKRIDITTKKTVSNLTIDFNKYSLEIIEKCKGIREDFVFRKFALNTFNDHLQELCLRAKIDSPVTIEFYRGNKRVEQTVPKWKEIGSHCARKTFVVNSIRLGIPLEVIMKITGHRTFEAVKHYMDVMDVVKSENMKKLDKFFE